jgi:hypothetical protein
MAIFMKRNLELGRLISLILECIATRHLHHDLGHMQTVGSAVYYPKTCALPGFEKQSPRPTIISY